MVRDVIREVFVCEPGCQRQQEAWELSGQISDETRVEAGRSPGMVVALGFLYGTR